MALWATFRRISGLDFWGEIDPKKFFSRIYFVRLDFGRIVGSNFLGGDRTEVQPHKKDRTEHFF